MRELVIGTRGSALAMWQAQWVAGRLAALLPDVGVRIEKIKTQGDVASQAPLWQIGGGGLFVKELERALLEGCVDFAVHSMKDLPFAMEGGLVVAAVPEREDPRDVVVSRHGLSLSGLPRGARVGTSSSRRRAQLLAYRRDLEIVPLRGNVDTRLRKAEMEELDAIVLAAAGLARLGYLGRVTEFLPLEICLPAIGQGALALQTRAEDQEAVDALAALDHPPSRAATEAERAFMRAMGGGCQLPMAALCQPAGATVEETPALDAPGQEDLGAPGRRELAIEALVASPDGSRVIRGRELGDDTDPVGLGERMARRLESLGAVELLREVIR